MVSPFFFLCVTFHIADEFYSRLLFLVVLQPLPDGIVAYPIFTTNCRISQLIDFSNQYVKAHVRFQGGRATRPGNEAVLCLVF